MSRQAPVIPQYNDKNNHDNRNNYPEIALYENAPKAVIDEIHAKASAGDKDALYRMAMIMRFGLGDKNIKSPSSYDMEICLSMASSGENANPRAQYELAKYYILLNSPEFNRNVYSLLFYAAKKGEPLAQLELGKHYRHGSLALNIPRNPEKAVELLQKSSDAGNLDAKYSLAFIYRDGEEPIAKNLQKALELFREAAEAGHEYSCTSLAHIYQYGVKDNGKVVVEKDLKKAEELYLRAPNDYQAKMHLGILYLNQSAKNIEKALDLYHEGLQLGYRGDLTPYIKIFVDLNPLLPPPSGLEYYTNNKISIHSCLRLCIDAKNNGYDTGRLCNTVFGYINYKMKENPDHLFQKELSAVEMLEVVDQIRFLQGPGGISPKMARDIIELMIEKNSERLTTQDVLEIAKIFLTKDSKGFISGRELSVSIPSMTHAIQGYVDSRVAVTEITAGRQQRILESSEVTVRRINFATSADGKSFSTECEISKEAKKGKAKAAKYERLEEDERTPLRTAEHRLLATATAALNIQEEQRVETNIVPLAGGRNVLMLDTESVREFVAPTQQRVEEQPRRAPSPSFQVVSGVRGSGQPQQYDEREGEGASASFA